MQHLEIPFGSQITLKSKFSQKYLGFKHQTQTLAASFPPPSIHINIKPGTPIDLALKLKIIPRQNEGKELSLLSEGSRVYLISTSGNNQEYLTSTSKGQLKFDKKSLNDEMNKMLFKSATWTISYASVQKTLSAPSKTPVTPFDSMVLKSVYGAYLTTHQHTLQCEAVLEMDEVRSVWQVQLANSLQLPEWLYDRPTFSKFLGKPQSTELTTAEKRNLRSSPEDFQEALLIEDILDVSMGFEGSYVKRRPGGSLYVIEPHLNNPSCSTALAQLTYRILEISSHYQKLMGFIKQLEFGKGVLIGALCDGLRKIVSQYYQQIIQLDEQAEKGISLQNLWVEIQDSLKILRALSQLIAAAKGLNSGQLITCLQRLINDTTDGFVLNVYKHIFEKLINLYIGMLSKWIYEGLIEDRYGEFMVKIEEKASLEWTNWQERFSLRTEQVPSILERDQEKILVTGKYLNILKACNRETHCPFSKDIQQNIQFHINRQNFTEPIQRAYDWANEQLLNLVFKECKLTEVLNSLKGYYFLKFGDLFIYFLDVTEDDLITQKKMKLDGKSKPFSVEKLQSKFDFTVRTSSASNDLCNEDISCKLDTMTVFEQVHRIKTLQSQTFQFNFNEKPYIKKDSKYIDYVTLDFKCEFPLNLILNKKTMSKYQAFFRLMLWCKFLERQLSQCWVMLQSLKQMGTIQCFRNTYKINHRILTFIKRLSYYLSEEVVEQNWLKLNTDLQYAKNFEEIIQCHDRFLNNCLKESLLTNAKLLPLLTADIGSTIYNYIQLKTYLQKVKDQYNLIKQQKPTDYRLMKQYKLEMQKEIEHLIEDQDFSEFLQKSAKAFDDGLQSFLREIALSTKKQQSHLMRLSEMLDEQKYINKPHHNYNL